LRLVCLGLLIALAAPVAVWVPAWGTAWAQSKTAPETKTQIELSFAPVVKKVAPAVVNIFSKRVIRQRSVSPFFNDPFFKRFFGKDFGMFGLPRERIQKSLGSGVIVSEDGLIVTNHHVIKGSTEIIVVLSDRREFAAELVLDDESTDLAVLRIDPDGRVLPYLAFRDSDEVEVGDLVLAIGNPFGVGQTVTSGIVSATARTQVGISDFSFFIQTDAAINPGNSGGALVTLDGKLLGINTAIYSRNGGSVGIGFAIPANMVETVVASALRGGELVRAWSGLIGQNLTPDLAEAFGLETPGGVIVKRVYPGGPADRAGARPGDVILNLEGRAVADVESFRYRIATREPGDRILIEVWRDRATRTLTLTPIAAPENPPRNEIQLSGQHPLTGAVVANLSPALAEELDLLGAWDGVIILKVARRSVADRLRFKPGDIIVTVNREEVRDVTALDAALKQAKDTWRISFSRKGKLRHAEFNL
jgi:serine protease Do